MLPIPAHRVALLGVAALMLWLGASGFAAPVDEYKSATFLDPELRQAGPVTIQVEDGKYAQLLHVASEAGAGADGSQAKPFAAIADALAAAAGASENSAVAIKVAAGTYKEHDLEMVPWVHLFGGFNPADWSRDIFQHQTIIDAGRQGDQRRNQPAQGQRERQRRNAGRAFVGADHARLDGFVITGAKARGHGGAILLDDTSPEITNNVFRNNTALAPGNFRHDRMHQQGNHGGAIAMYYMARPLIANNLFVRNSTQVGGGGAISAWGEMRGTGEPRAALITRNVFIENVSGVGDKQNTRSSNGGAIQCTHQSPVIITHNVFVRNRAEGNGDAGGVYCEYEAMPLVAGNVFAGNRAFDDGGGMYLMKNSMPEITGNCFAGGISIRGGASGIRLSKGGMGVIHHNVMTHGPGGGLSIVDSWARVHHNTMAHNPGGGIGYQNNRLEYLRGPIIEYNLLANPTGNLSVASEFDPAVVRHNVMQGEPVGEDAVLQEPEFVDDGQQGTFGGLQYDERNHVTKLSGVAGLGQNAAELAGRAIRVGTEYSVIKSIEGDVVTVWGDVREPLPPTETPYHEDPKQHKIPEFDAKSWEILKTYQLQAGSNLEAYGWTARAEEPAQN